ncbi:MAG: 3-deoxy-D-manno-octulosonic acid transferase [Bacteroidia bacterium]|nr:3-deoxy-D-manno-octulosonic acid transferase [Bacteroidia bacterium]
MQWLYLLIISAYGWTIRFAALFNQKAKDWIIGRRGWEEKLRSSLSGKSNKRIWFHCPSLGEFEQGRPVLEQIRRQYPDHCIVLTFFSPSGYNVRKNEPLADIVMYMPLDGPVRSRKFVQLVQPQLVFFVKYDFWYYYGKVLHGSKIPFFCVSAIFRPSQLFFKRYGKFFRKILTRYTHIFVQDQSSLELLYKNAIPAVTVSGDTRFDRVLENVQRRSDELNIIAQFAEGGDVLVAGSTWKEDEKLLADFLRAQPSLKLIIAPHELNEDKLAQLKQRFFGKAVRYTQVVSEGFNGKQVLIIDTIGMLSLIYRYGKYTYVGGGFGRGIHNILEAAVYGKPVFFGPNYKKFREARDLKAMGCGIVVKNSQELTHVFNELQMADELYKSLASKSRKYIEDRKGATEILMNFLRMNYPA